MLPEGGTLLCRISSANDVGSQTAHSSKGSGLNVSWKRQDLPLVEHGVIGLNEGCICCHVALQPTHHIHLHCNQASGEMQASVLSSTT